MVNKFDVLQAAGHIADIADTNDIEISGHSFGGRAWRRSRRVKIRPIKSAVTYAIAMHEIGHVLGEQRGRRVEKEVQAWDWAKAHAIIWTPRMEQTKRKCLQSYIRWAEHKQARCNRVFIESHDAIYREC